MREAMQLVLQELIELEADPDDRRRPLRAHRRAHDPPQRQPRARLLSTKAGDVELRIPKLREGAFFPSLLEPRRRIDRALWAVVMEAYVHGVSTRKVDDLVHGPGHRRRRSARARCRRICAELDGAVGGVPGAPPRPRRASRTCSSTPPTSRPTRAPRSCPRRS